MVVKIQKNQTKKLVATITLLLAIVIVYRLIYTPRGESTEMAASEPALKSDQMDIPSSNDASIDSQIGTSSEDDTPQGSLSGTIIQTGSDYVGKVWLCPEVSLGVYSALDDQRIVCFDISSGQVQWAFEGQRIFAASHDCSSIMIASYKSNHVLDLNLSDGSVKKDIEIAEGGIILDLSPPNILAEDPTGEVFLSDSTGTIIERTGRKGPAFFVPDRELLFFTNLTDVPYEVLLTDFEGASLLHFGGLSHPVKGVAVNPSETLAAIISGKGVGYDQYGHYFDYRLTVVRLSDGETVFDTESEEQLASIQFIDDDQLVFISCTSVVSMSVEDGAAGQQDVLYRSAIPYQARDGGLPNCIYTLWLSNPERHLAASADFLGTIELWTW